MLTRTRRMSARRGLTAHVMVGAGLVTGALLFSALTGCGAVGPGAGTGGGHALSVQQRSRTVWLRFAQCARSHGVPNFPDPNVNSQGQASYPNAVQAKQESSQVQGACGAILRQLPAAAANPPPTAAQLRQLQAFALCMRQHGVPNWPDPKPDGTFPIAGTPLASEGKTGPVLAGMAACSHIYSGGISAS